MSTSPGPVSPSLVPSRYERWNDRLIDWCPYVTLAVSAVLALAFSTDSGGERLLTAGLVALAALWVFVGYTRAPRPRKAHPVRMIVYFIGLLVIASALFVPLFAFVMLLGGVYLPRMLLPEFLIRIGDFTPPGVQAMLDAWSGTSPQLTQLAVMVLITVVAGATAAKRFRWE